jgi:hypothetical protein
MSKENDREIEELRREVAALKAALKRPDPAALEREARAWRAEMHALAEKRAAGFGGFSREDLRAMAAACPPDTVRDLVSHGTVQRPSGDGASGQVTKVSSSPGLPGSGTGWVEPRRLGPQPGINHVDRLAQAQDARDRAQREKER